MDGGWKPPARAVTDSVNFRWLHQTAGQITPAVHQPPRVHDAVVRAVEYEEPVERRLNAERAKPGQQRVSEAAAATEEGMTAKLMQGVLHCRPGKFFSVN